MKRDEFSGKYGHLAKEWGIASNILDYIVIRYSKLLQSEIEGLKKSPLNLPSYFKDKRTDEEYIYDLIDGWLIEDLIFEGWLHPKLKSLNEEIKIQYSGTNRDRVIQKNSTDKISTLPDFKYEFKGNTTSIELQMARSSLSEGYDMKESKVKRSILINGLFLWVIIPQNCYFIIDASSELSSKKAVPNPKWGGKLVFHISIDDIDSFGGFRFMKDKIPDIYLKKMKLI